MKPIVLRLCGLGALVLAVTVVVAGCGGQAAENAPGGGGSSLPASFALLKAAEASPPHSVMARLAASFGPHRRPRISASYRLETPLGKAWMLAAEAPGTRGETCLVMERPGVSSCAADATARRIGLALGLSTSAGPPSSHARRFTVMGVVPDWVRSVIVAPLDERPMVLPVRSNVFIARRPAPILIKKYCRGFDSACQAIH